MSGYIHGYTDEEEERLLAQAEFLAPYALSGIDLTGVDRLLEVGGGVGAETRLLFSRFPEMKVLGVDIQQASLVRARSHLDERVQVLRASGTQLPLPSGAFDAALFIWVLEHVGDPLALLRE